MGSADVITSGPTEVDRPRPQDRPAPPRRGRLRWPGTGQIVCWILLLGFAGLFLYPFAWLLSASLKPRGEVFDNKLIPDHLTFSNFVHVFDVLPVQHWLFNSLYIAVLAAGFVTVSSSMVAFGFAYFRFPFKKTLFALLVGSMMLPGAVTLVPNFLVWQSLGFVGTTVPLWGHNLFGSAFYIFLLRQFFLGLPRDTFEAARLDGCSYFGLYRRICLPLSVPSLIIVFLFEFQASWSNLQQPLIYLNFASAKDFTVPLGISYAMTRFSPTAGGQGDYQWVMTAALLVTLPMVILFAMGQRYIIDGIATQGRKG